MMLIRDVLRFCVVLHISFYKGSECALVIKPQDVFAVSGEIATLHCSSSASTRGHIFWSVNDPGNYIYTANELHRNVTSYISVSDRDDGNCSLNIIASLSAAKIYICRDDSGDQASAELTVMNNSAKCRQFNDGSFSVSCSIVSAGKWAPTVVCEQENEDYERSSLKGHSSRKSEYDNVATTTWSFRSKGDTCYTVIMCFTEFNSTLRSRQAISRHCPSCNSQGLPSRRRFLNIDDYVSWPDSNYSCCFSKIVIDVLEGYENALFAFSIISYTLTVCALLFTFLTYTCTWKLSGSAQAVFLLNLCFALILVSSSLLVGILQEGEFKDGCKDIVLLLQYFILATFFILLAEGVQLLLYINSDYQDRRTIETILLAAFAWGLPIIIVVVSNASSDVEGDGISPVCWLILNRGFVWALAAPVLTIILAYCVILIVVLICINRKRSLPKNAKKRNEIRATIWNMLLTWPVLCIGCLFGAISTVFFLHLFFFINLLQGLNIFIFHALCNNKEMNDKFPSIYLKYKSHSSVTTQTPLIAEKMDKSLVRSASISSVSTQASLTKEPAEAPDMRFTQEPAKKSFFSYLVEYLFGDIREIEIVEIDAAQ